MSISLSFSSLAILIIYVTSIIGKEVEKKNDDKTEVNFVVKETNSLGEKEIRLSYNKMKAIEATSPNLGEGGLKYEYLTNGKKVITSAYKGFYLIDCDITWGSKSLNEFYEKFYHRNENSRVAIEGLTGGLPKSYYLLLDFHTKERDCHNLHRYQRRPRFDNWSSYDNFVDVNFTKDASNAGYQMPSSGRPSYNSKRRTKRAAFIYPGTKWCGTGNVAGGMDDLGENAATDKCCRSHDLCPVTISGFERNYGLLNYRFHTLSHCHCDDIFRNCLKNVDTSISNMVGDLFFNVIKIKCFEFEAEAQCTNRSYFGACMKYEDKFIASIKPSLGY